MINQFYIWLSYIGVGFSLIAAVLASLTDASQSPVRVVTRPSRHRSPLTVIIYYQPHGDTRASLRQLRRVASLPLTIIVAVSVEYDPASAVIRQIAAQFPDVHIQYSRQSSSRSTVVASCYRVISSEAPVLVIDSGDIVSAATLHSLRRVLSDNSHLTSFEIPVNSPLEPTFVSLVDHFGQTARRILLHAIARLPFASTRHLPAGIVLRDGRQLREMRRHLASVYNLPPIIRTRALQLPRWPLWSVTPLLALLAIVSYGYFLAAGLQTAQPLLLVWIVCSWWGIVSLSFYRAARPLEYVTLASIIPLMGILLPVVGLFIVTLALQRTVRLLLRQGLTWTRRKHLGHGVFFGARHP